MLDTTDGNGPLPQADPPAESAERRRAGDRAVQVLLVEDDANDAERVRGLVDQEMGTSISTHHVGTLAEALSLLDEHLFDAILADLTLPDAYRLDGIRQLIDRAPDLPLIVLSAWDDPVTPMDALRLGAQDYLVKDELTAAGLVRSLRYAIIRRQTEADLAEANTDLEDVAAMLVHDLRAPVRTARLLASRLVSQQASEQSTQIRELLEAALTRVDRLIVSMVEYGDLRAASPELGPVVLARAVEQAFASLLADLEAAGASWRPLADESLVVAADHDLLVTVFENLISNSVRYRRPEVPVEVVVHATTDGDHVQVTVQDNGVGIPPDRRDQAMQVMQRLGSDNTSGLGLGLAICRRIVEAFRGQISILPMDGPGTIVCIRLPIHRGHSDGGAEEPSS